METTQEKEFAPLALAELGWTDELERARAETGQPELLPCRVVGEERGLWRIQGVGTGVFWGELPGKWRKDVATRLDLPAVGDWTLTERSGEGRGLIQHLLPRKSCLVRKAAGEGDEPQVLAANVDVAFLVTSLNADLNLRRLERYLTLVWDGGAQPVILLTKSDLVTDHAAIVAEVQAIAPGVEVSAICAKQRQGLGSVLGHLTSGKTGVVLGSSGVGKSTLINTLIGRSKLKTQGTRNDDKGRHTTTSRYLLALPEGGLIIDTPGMRELHLWDQEEGLDKLFEDIGELALACRFTNCRHETEPDCAVLKAVEGGELPRERLASYRKLEKEADAQRRKHDKAFASEERKKGRSIHKSLRLHPKKRGPDEPKS